MNILVKVVSSDRIINQFSFQVTSILQGLIRLLEQSPIRNYLTIEFSQFLLFRLALPRVLQVSDDFATMYQKSLNKTRG